MTVSHWFGFWDSWFLVGNVMYVFPVGACYDSSLGSVIDNSSYNGPPVIKFDSSPYWPLTPESGSFLFVNFWSLLRVLLITLVIVRFHFINFHRRKDDHLQMILDHWAMMMLDVRNRWCQQLGKFNIFRLQFTIGDWNHGKQNYG